MLDAQIYFPETREGCYGAHGMPPAQTLAWEPLGAYLEPTFPFNELAYVSWRHGLIAGSRYLSPLIEICSYN